MDGLVLAASTGESPTLNPEEREWLVATAVEIASERPSRCRVKIVANTGTNDTAATIRATRRAAQLGADAAMVVAPYYNKPDQRMIEAHFRAIADDGALPIIVYNVPSRTGVNVETATLMRLAEHPRIVAVKEASANMDQIAAILRERPARLLRPRRRRRLDPADAGDGRRRRDLHVRQRDPGRDGGPVRGRVRRRLGCRAADPRALAAADEGQLRRRSEPRPGEGRPGADGAHDRHGPDAAAAARGRRTGPGMRLVLETAGLLGAAAEVGRRRTVSVARSGRRWLAHRAPPAATHA